MEAYNTAAWELPSQTQQGQRKFIPGTPPRTVQLQQASGVAQEWGGQRQNAGAVPPPVEAAAHTSGVGQDVTVPNPPTLPTLPAPVYHARLAAAPRRRPAPAFRCGLLVPLGQPAGGLDSRRSKAVCPRSGWRGPG